MSPRNYQDYRKLIIEIETAVNLHGDSAFRIEKLDNHIAFLLIDGGIIDSGLKPTGKGGSDLTSVTPFKKYLMDNYEKSAFDSALNDTSPWVYHLHGRRIVSARLTRNSTYEIVLAADGQAEEEIPKTDVKLLCPVSHSEAVAGLIKVDQKVRARELDPIISLKERHHIKNKTLFPLMEERTVLFFTLLEGEVIRGLVTDFSRYDLTISLKGGVTVVVMRHAVLDVRDKKGRCYLKACIK